jgi:FkbM family methyltransferase
VNPTLRRWLDTAAARAICASLVRESAAFFVHDSVPRSAVRLYRLRENGVHVAIRHRSFDAATLAEVFYQRWNHPPEEVARALGEPREIVDLGANIGLFGALAVTLWPSARIVGYEPDPVNAAIHERTIRENGLHGRWSVIRAAAGTRDGEVRFAAGHGPSSHVLDREATSADRVLTVRQRDVLPAIARADLVKIDIEGGEWEIVGDPRFAAQPPRAVILEYHPARCASPDPSAEAVRLLAAAGMRTSPVAGSERDGFGMVWGWRA